jgi:hypothetical protein
MIAAASRLHFAVELDRGDDAIDEPPVARRFRVDEFAGEQHLERALARHVARNRYTGCRAEQSVS